MVASPPVRKSPRLSSNARNNKSPLLDQDSSRGAVSASNGSSNGVARELFSSEDNNNGRNKKPQLRNEEWNVQERVNGSRHCRENGVAVVPDSPVDAKVEKSKRRSGKNEVSNSERTDDKKSKKKSSENEVNISESMDEKKSKKRSGKNEVNISQSVDEKENGTEESKKKPEESSKKRRSSNPGVRVIGGRIYDSENGKTCHQCRQKTLDCMVSCKNSEAKRPCKRHFCFRYGENGEEASNYQEWNCPVCRGICNCSVCMKKQGCSPTGILVHTAKATGFASVADLLKVQGVSEDQVNALNDSGLNMLLESIRGGNTDVKKIAKQLKAIKKCNSVKEKCLSEKQENTENIISKLCTELENLKEDSVPHKRNRLRKRSDEKKNPDESINNLADAKDLGSNAHCAQTLVDMSLHNGKNSKSTRNIKVEDSKKESNISASLDEKTMQGSQNEGNFKSSKKVLRKKSKSNAENENSISASTSIDEKNPPSCQNNGIAKNILTGCNKKVFKAEHENLDIASTSMDDKHEQNSQNNGNAKSNKDSESKKRKYKHESENGDKTGNFDVKPQDDGKKKKYKHETVNDDKVGNYDVKPQDGEKDFELGKKENGKNEQKCKAFFENKSSSGKIEEKCNALVSETLLHGESSLKDDAKKTKKRKIEPLTISTNAHGDQLANENVPGPKKVRIHVNAKKAARKHLDSRAEDIALPKGKSLQSVCGSGFAPDEIGMVLQFLEFCLAFSEVLGLKKGQAESILRELTRGRIGRNGIYSTLVQFHVKLLSLIAKENGESSEVSHLDSGSQSWVQALGRLIREKSHYIKEESLSIYRNISPDERGKIMEEFNNFYGTIELRLKGGTDGYSSLTNFAKLKLLNLLCDECLSTQTLRNWIGDENDKHAASRKEKREEILAAKEKAKAAKQIMKDEIARMLVAKSGSSLSIEQHDQILAKIKLETAKAMAAKEDVEQASLRLKEDLCSAIRTQCIVYDKDGRAYWRLKGSGGSNVLVQEIINMDPLLGGDGWYCYNDEDEKLLKKHLALSRANKRHSHEVASEKCNDSIEGDPLTKLESETLGEAE